MQTKPHRHVKISIPTEKNTEATVDRAAKAMTGRSEVSQQAKKLGAILDRGVTAGEKNLLASIKGRLPTCT